MTATSPARLGADELLRPTGLWRNWGRSESARPAFLARPTSTDQVVGVIRAARDRGLTVKAVGAGHSFTAIAATQGVLLDLGGLDGLLAVDERLRRVTLGAGTNLSQLPALLEPFGLALENMGDIDRQTIAGATSTGTHGTGSDFRGLAAQITGAVLVTADGTVLRIDGETNAELLPAVRLGLGALGIVTELTVQCVPAFLLHAAERPERFDEVLDDFAARSASVDHFEFYWWPHTDRVMTKRNTRLPGDAPRHPVSPFANFVEERVMSNGALALMCRIGHAVPVCRCPPALLMSVADAADQPARHARLRRPRVHRPQPRGVHGPAPGTLPRDGVRRAPPRGARGGACRAHADREERVADLVPGRGARRGLRR